MNSGKPKSRYCIRCDSSLQDKQINYCSEECSRISSRRVERPSYEEIIADKSVMTMEAIGMKYGVSSNAVRKWLKTYERDTAILSQAESTLSEGAETSGEVQSS